MQIFVKVKKNFKKKADSLKKNSDSEMENFLKLQWYTNKVQKVCMEWDSLLILPEYKMIINIEVKSGAGFDPLKTAASQTDLHLSIFKNIFGSLLSNEWKFFKAACTPNLITINGNQPCKYCKQFILTVSELRNLKSWINSLTNSCKKYIDQDYANEYDNLLVGIIGFSSMRKLSELNKLIVDPNELSKTTEKKLTHITSGVHRENPIDKDNDEYMCFMLTPKQLNVVYSQSEFIIIHGDYGTGKTYVLKERCKKIAKQHQDKKIAYINLTGLDIAENVNYDFRKTMMDFCANNEFEDFTNVDILTCWDLYDHNANEHIPFLGGDVIKKFFMRLSYDYIFIDEGFSLSDDIISHVIQHSISLCLAIKSSSMNEHRTIEFMKNMEINFNASKIHLIYNLRNTENIMKIASLFSKNTSDCLSPEKNVIGPICYHYFNDHGLKQDVLVRAAINRYFKDNKEPVVVLFSPFIVFVKDVYLYLKKTYSKIRSVVYFADDKNFNESNEKYATDLDNLKLFIKEPQGILVTDLQSFHGAQARNVIIILHGNLNSCNTFEVRNIILRTMSFAIVIHSSSYINSSAPIPGLVQDHDLHNYIHAGSKEPVYHHYENITKKKENVLAKACINKYFHQYKHNILILTNDCGELTGNELRSSFPSRIIVNTNLIPIPKSFTVEDLEKHNNKTKVIINLFDIPGSIIILDFPKILNNILYYYGIVKVILDRAQDVIIFLKEEEEELSEKFMTTFRNQILRDKLLKDDGCCVIAIHGSCKDPISFYILHGIFCPVK